MPLGVGLIGAGDIAAYHLRAWSSLPEARVLAICDRVPERARGRASAFNIRATNAATMIAETKLDALDIVTWRGDHAAMVGLAVANGLACPCARKHGLRARPKPKR